MKSETIIRKSSSLKTVCFLFLTTLFLVSAESLYAQENKTPVVDIQLRKKLDYERPPRLQEEDIREGKSFQFVSGLEIITDIEYVKIYIFDVENGRTPFESNDITNGYIRVKLEKPGYRDFSFWVNVKEDYRTTAHVYYEEKPRSSVSGTPVDNTIPERDSHPLYLSFNPGDPAYYRQIFLLNSEDSDSHYTAILKSKESEKIFSLVPEGTRYPFIFTWDGKDVLGEKQKDGIYSLQMNPGQTYKVELNRMYSRKAANYFTGTAGLVLVPTAQILFPGGFQFGSSFSIDRNPDGGTSGGYSLPFSFFLRFSPLKRWESSFEAEVAFINESGEPSLRLNSSQKAYIYGNDLFQLSLGLRGSYKGAINDLKQNVQNSLIRDPSGFSFFIPMQFELSNWDFMISPEFLYTLNSQASADISDSFDILGVMRWGVSYSNAIFGAAFSSALYLPSYNGNKMVMQVGVEGSFYIPGTPMYINLFAVDQTVKEGRERYSIGLNLGFLF
ncbi:MULTISPECIES: PEGA domain-containing protein [unclassified Oceanispirochaeta]|uniref:PEGA domain-containing protein n=1 Tax=unclassified Oceanispirochaeta TaxID=2635722 RepID=UPI000E09BA5E|nr:MULTISPECIES: PEGA domain-containing protein [unclassified Oceanispirochaeta]MBF9017672.1 PEGA domain-containing protein [Oceanispirochaeta sp. M2]NPD74244.1 PEGA domain-containing protein [Oceanispirochaeta sp. M1]RDG29950.1 PEGA domain-containing protein [Oceanispirochaeta sp. M1]